MFVYTPQKKYKKQKNGPTTLVLDGVYMVLVRPDEPDADLQPIRAIFRSVRMRADPVSGQLIGTLNFHGYSTLIVGLFGCHGMSLRVPRSVYEQGKLIPPVLEEIWAKAVLGDQKILAEFNKWARYAYTGNKSRACYRCSLDFTSEGPCSECIVEIRKVAQEAKPEPITIKPVGIESQEKVNG